MSAALDWQRDGADWPNRAASRFVAAGGLDWHVQVMGQGPVTLLLHGTGSSSHSWRDMLPRLAERLTVVAPDLPGHAFTTRPRDSNGLGLIGMANALAALLEKLGLRPERAVGHSAGCAILVRMTSAKQIAPTSIVAFNGAYFPYGGAAASFFSPVSRLIGGSSFVAKLLSSMADERTVTRLLRDTGSSLDARGLDLYRRLFASERHVASTMGMMGAWDLTTMESDLRRLQARLYLVKATGDRSIEPAVQDRVARLAPMAALTTLTGLGHLAHEQSPQLASAIVADPEAHAGRTLPG